MHEGCLALTEFDNCRPPCVSRRFGARMAHANSGTTCMYAVGIQENQCLHHVRLLDAWLKALHVEFDQFREIVTTTRVS